MGRSDDDPWPAIPLPQSGPAVPRDATRSIFAGGRERTGPVESGEEAILEDDPRPFAEEPKQTAAELSIEGRGDAVGIRNPRIPNSLKNFTAADANDRVGKEAKEPSEDRRNGQPVALPAQRPKPARRGVSPATTEASAATAKTSAIRTA
jgi:hypothetical protein